MAFTQYTPPSTTLDNAVRNAAANFGIDVDKLNKAVSAVDITIAHGTVNPDKTLNIIINDIASGLFTGGAPDVGGVTGVPPVGMYKDTPNNITGTAQPEDIIQWIMRNGVNLLSVFIGLIFIGLGVNAKSERVG
jgi:hypothetical protein